MGKFRVSQSRVKIWRRCKRAHHYRYYEKLEKKVKSRPLKFGSIVHEMLEAHAEREDPFELLDETAKKQGKMFQAEYEEYGDIIEDIRFIMKAYFKYYKGDKLKYVKIDGKRSEHELDIDVGDGIFFTMKLDGIGKTPNKLRWLIEHKTGKAIPDEDQRWRDLQTSVYIKALEILGMPPVDGVLWNYIRSKSPTRPQVLKAGGLSTRNIDTLPSVVRAFGKANDAPIPEILLERAEANIPRFFQRVYTPLHRDVVEFLYKDFMISAREILEIGDKRNELSIEKHCGWCDFESICRTELTGGDSDFVKEREYAKKKKRKSGGKPSRKSDKKSTGKAGK